MKTKFFLLFFVTNSLLVNAQVETIPTGALIINMGSTTPTVNNSLKPYGLIWDIIKNNKAQVRWVISQSKLKDGIDFTYNSIDYKGGTFIIPAEFRTAAVNAKIAALSTSIISVTTTTPLTVNVTYNLKYTPRWTFDFDNGSIAQGYLTNAGIPLAGFPLKKPTDLNSCDDLFVMPHADPVWATHKNLLNWNQNSKGWIWAACHAVSAMENIYNPANPTQQLNFLSNRFSGFGVDQDPANTWAGNSLVLWTKHSDPLTNYTYTNPNDAEMQFMGTITGGVGANGSEKAYMPYNATSGGAAGRIASWRSSTTVAAFDGSAAATNPNIPEFTDGLVALVAYGRGFGDDTRGKVMYEGGHSHDGTSAAFVSAQRIFFNFCFLSTYDKDPVPALSISSTSVLSTDTINLALSLKVGYNLSDYNINWTSSCGGTFINQYSATAKFIAPPVASCGPCTLFATVTDGCGRQFYERININICPAPPTALDKSTLVVSNPPGTGAINIGAITPLSGTDPDGTIASFTITSLPTVAQGVLSIICPPTPTGATCTGGFANLTAAVLAANPAGIVLTPSQAQTFRFDPADGFGGNATFNYTVTDNVGLLDATPATYTIPVNPPPVAIDVTTAPIASTAGPTAVSTQLSATDNGTIVSYIISSLPPSSQGVLFLNGIPVIVGQVLTPLEATQLSFDPSGTYIGYAQVTYTATDNNGAIDATPATLSIQIVNQPPVAQDISTPVIANPNGTGQTAIPSLVATDADGTIASYTIVSVPLVTEGVLYYFNGTSYVVAGGGQVLTPAQAASLKFDPADGFTGNATFTYSTTDNLGLIDNTPATYNIPVGIVPPIADNITNPSIYSGAGQTSINPLTGNDPDATNIIASFTISTIPPASQGVLYYDKGGTYMALTAGQILTPAQAASLKFDPADGFTGNAIFTYTVTDDESLTDQSPATFTIPITNQPPVATNITNAGINNTAGPTSINPLAATDADGSIATYTITSLPDPSKGILFLSGVPVVPGQVLTPAQIALLQFDPAPFATGSAVFNFTATDNQGATDATPATFTIPLISVPIPPTSDDKMNTALNYTDGPTSIIGLTGSDADGTVISYVINALPPAAQGVLMLNGVPVTVGQVIPANLANQLQFDPSGTYTGNAVFRYSAIDNEGFTNTSPATFTIPIVNNPPVADDITINNIKTGSTVRIPSLTGSDADGTIANYTISTLPTLGTLQVDLTGTGTFIAVNAGQVLTPAQAARLRIISGAVVGNSVFTYTITDNLGAVDATPASYTIPISGAASVNQPPTVNDIINPSLNASAGQTAINPLIGVDVDGTIATYTLLTIPPPNQGVLYYTLGTVVTAITEGGLLLTPAQMATLKFDPSGTYIGNVNFTYTANDNTGDIATSPANYTIPIINNPPNANNVTNPALNSGNGPTTINAFTATDADGTVANYRITTIPLASQGILSLNGVPVMEGQVLTPVQAALLQFDPAPTFSGNATFTFTAIDNLGGIDATPATFTIPVNNLPPVADDKISQLITNSNGTAQQPIPALTGVDVDGSIATFTINSLPLNGTLYLNGVTVSSGQVIPLAQANLLSFDPNDGFSGTTTFNYTTTDNNGNIDATPALYSIRVNTPPTTNNLTTPAVYAGGANSPILPLVGADDGSIQFYTITTLPAVSQGVLYLNGVAVTDLSQVATLTALQITQLSFTPAATFTGTTFTYTATDNLGIIDVTPAVYTIPQKIIISGSVWNDVNGGLTIDGSETNINGTNAGGGITTGAVLYVNLIDGLGNVVATAAVQTDGSYTFPTVPPNATLSVQLTTNQGVIGQPKPATALPTGWVTTGENKNGLGGLPDATPNGEIIINTNNTNIITQNFGIEKLPESAVSSNSAGSNPGGFSNTSINPNFFVTSNVGANPNTLDYNGGTVINIRVTAFPNNANSITINGIVYTNGGVCPPATSCTPWPIGGVITAFTNGVGPTQSILIDPVDGISLTVVIPFAAIDNAGKEDATPGSVSLVYNTVLPVKIVSFTALPNAKKVIIQWKVTDQINIDYYIVETSTDGRAFKTIATSQAITSISAQFDAVHLDPINGLNYYRIKTVEKDGSFSYTEIKRVLFGKNSDVQIYPNPLSTGILQISVTGNFTNKDVLLSLFSVDGKLILQRKSQVINQITRLDVGSLPNGSYVLTIATENGDVNKMIQIIK